MASAARITRAILFAAVLAAAACDAKRTGPTEPREISPPARSYLEQVVALMQRHSINQARIDWNSFRADVFAAAAGAQSVEATYPAIRVALRLLGDGHSSFRTPSGTLIFVSKRTCTAPTVGAVPPLPNSIGYVRVRGFSGTAEQAATFASSLQDSIRANDREGLVGWIVDLRNNGGGNMWPMIAGVGPVLGEGVLGYFISPDGAETAWGYESGASVLNGQAVQQVGTPYHLRREHPRVAVLTDNRVASSGEAVAIAFKQRPDTRSFGTATCGLSTANRGFPMGDGAVLNLTVSVMADRTRQPYGDAVVPDENIEDPDQVIQRAIAWLQSER